MLQPASAPNPAFHIKDQAGIFHENPTPRPRKEEVMLSPAANRPVDRIDRLEQVARRTVHGARHAVRANAFFQTRADLGGLAALRRHQPLNVRPPHATLVVTSRSLHLA